MNETEQEERNARIDGSREYLRLHDRRVVKLDRMGVTALRAIHRTASEAAGLQLVYGGPVTKDEFIAAIIELEFPDITSVRKTYVDLVTSCPGGC